MLGGVSGCRTVTCPTIPENRQPTLHTVYTGSSWSGSVTQHVQTPLICLSWCVLSKGKNRRPSASSLASSVWLSVYPPSLAPSSSPPAVMQCAQGETLLSTPCHRVFEWRGDTGDGMKKKDYKAYNKPLSQ